MEIISRACASIVARRLSHWFASASQSVSGTLSQSGSGWNLQAANPAFLKLTNFLTASVRAHTTLSTRVRAPHCAPYWRGNGSPGETPSTAHSTPWRLDLQRCIHLQSPVWVLAKPGSYVTLNNLRDNPGATRNVSHLPSSCCLSSPCFVLFA